MKNTTLVKMKNLENKLKPATRPISAFIGGLASGILIGTLSDERLSIHEDLAVSMGVGIFYSPFKRLARRDFYESAKRAAYFALGTMAGLTVARIVRLSLK